MISKRELESAFAKAEREQTLWGAVSVVQDGETLFEKGYGEASLQLSVPNTPDTKFHIASVSKMFISMAALILQEAGRIDFTARPGDYLPELEQLDPRITIHHLLSHTSGLQDIYSLNELRYEVARVNREGQSFLQYLSKLPMMFTPGEKWSYSSTGFILTGFLMERVTGLPFAELMRRYVLEPLRMEDSGIDDPRRVNPRRAYGHSLSDGKFTNADNDRFADADAPGELYSTVRDLKKWCDAMFDCPLVFPETLNRMFTPHGHVHEQMYYGYGWFLNGSNRMHMGGTPGFCSHIQQYTKNKVSVILLFNYEKSNRDKLLSILEPVIQRSAGILTSK